ncbi:leucine-rich repeat protein [Carboxylicivirga linearis]|uniref:Leucine-rich repeat protein n=1 Tax=Carboxylicivirga linearis TaxID=1628157 RepID=A0ABS5JTZ5_9BACT|nr:leucine-rich repeat protein [Carboxylicivirga linearis]MBS2098270.1 leucine-rich repeat protein [Carboxylicivirga linearis]
MDGITVRGIIDGKIFSNKSINRIQLPSTFEIIGSYAFQNCKLGQVTIPSSVRRIGKYAFDHNLLKEVVIEGNSNLEIIELNAFSQNDHLEGITVPSLLKAGIGEFGQWINGHSESFEQGELMTFFETTYGLAVPYTLKDQDVTIDQDGVITDVTFDAKYNYIIIPERLNNIEVKAINGGFRYKKILQTILPAGIKSIGKIGSYYPFDQTLMTKLMLPENNTPNFVGWVGTSRYSTIFRPDMAIIDFNATYEISYLATLNEEELEINESGEIITYTPLSYHADITIPETINGITVKAIGQENSSNSNLFRSKGVLSVNLPKTLTHIHENSFADNVIQSIELPANLQYIGNKAFYKNNLTYINLPNDLKVIGDNAFQNNYIESLVLPESLTSIGIRAFSENQLTNLELPNSPTKYGNYVFEKNKLHTIVFPQDFEEITTGMFMDNQLEEIQIPASITCVRSYAFSNNNLSQVSFNENSYLKRIELKAFENNELLTHIMMPSSIYPTCIGWYNSNYQPIDQQAFYSEFHLGIAVRCIYTLQPDDVELNDEGQLKTVNFDEIYKDIIIPESINGINIKELGSDIDRTFERRWLLSVDIPNSVEKIYEYCFYDNRLSDVHLPDCLVEVGEYAFYNNRMEKIVLPTPERYGYELEYWKNQYGKKLSDNIATPLYYAFTAVFNAVIYNIVYNVNEASHTNPQQYTIETATINLLDATKEGYNFLGWYDNEQLTGDPITEISQGSTGDIQLWPKWEVATILSKVPSQSVKCYPNPFTNTLTIQIPENIKAFGINIYNTNGRLVQMIDVPQDGAARINLSYLAKGVYIVYIQQSEAAPIVKKIIKE